MVEHGRAKVAGVRRAGARSQLLQSTAETALVSGQDSIAQASQHTEMPCRGSEGEQECRSEAATTLEPEAEHSPSGALEPLQPQPSRGPLLH